MSDERFVQWDGHQTWCRVVGDREAQKPPLVMLHGGPGVPHDYLESLAVVADTGRAVVFYDQLGCGRSDRLPDAPAEFWTPDLFKRELVELTSALGIDRHHVYGQSWGGMLAMEHALERPAGLASIIVADSPASIPLWLEETAKLRADLPDDVQEILDRHEAAGTTEDAEYIGACMTFYERHLCRIPFPEELMRSFGALMQDNTVYSAMWGPSEFTCTGSLHDWDITDRLGEIDVPTLIISGRYDEATPAVVEPVHKGIPRSEWLLCEDSSHSPHVEEHDKVVRTVTEFLERVDGA